MANSDLSKKGLTGYESYPLQKGAPFSTFAKSTMEGSNHTEALLTAHPESKATAAPQAALGFGMWIFLANLS